MGKHKQMTRHAFISHMEDYIKKLLKNPLTADTDDFLKSYNILPTRALSMLLNPTDENDKGSSVLLRFEHIKNGGIDDDGHKKKDIFKITYKLPRKNYLKKMRHLYKKLYENSNIVTPNLLNEEGEGGAISGDANASTNTGTQSQTIDYKNTGADNSGQYVKKLGNGVIKRKTNTIIVSEEQLEKIKQMIREEAEMDTAFGDFGYDVPMGGKRRRKHKGKKKGKRKKTNRFWDEANNHHDIMRRSFPGHLEEDIHIKKKNKGKFNATKKRTGKSTEELTHSKNPITRKRATFAKMAKRHWKPI